jgi:hypothetical protein
MRAARAKAVAAAARDAAGVGEAAVHRGGCLCGAVAFSAEGLRDIWFCHCRQCRRVTGHYLGACRTGRDRFGISGEVRWSPHSGSSELGRCAACASPLFWRREGSADMSVLTGSLDDTEGLRVLGHVFVAEKGDYYALTDNLPQYAGAPEGGF